MNDTTHQTRYFREYTQLKEHCIYFNLYIASDNKIEYWKNIILAVGSSAALGTWAVWQKYPFLWGFIIALTQLIQAISPLLPYKKRMDLLGRLTSELDGLCIQAESDWYRIETGKCPQDEMSQLYIKLKKKKRSISESVLKGYTIPIAPRLSEEAKRLREIYFNNQYPGNHNAHQS